MKTLIICIVAWCIAGYIFMFTTPNPLNIILLLFSATIYAGTQSMIMKNYEYEWFWKEM